MKWLALLCALFVPDETPPFAHWIEGTQGATRDYYNRAAHLEWRTFLGDWRDAKGAPQGNEPYAIATLVDDDKPGWIEWDVTTLVREWIAGKSPNKGFFLRPLEGGFYDEDGEKMRTMRFQKLREVQGRWVPHRWTVVPHNKKGYGTAIVVREFRFDQEFSDDLFTTRNLKQR